MPRTRSSLAAVTIASVPPRRNPAIHTPVTSRRASSASTAARTSASQPSIEKSPSDGPVPAERERESGPARLARDAIAQRRVGVAERGRAAGTAREARAARAARERARHPGGRAKCALSRSPSETISSTCSRRPFESGHRYPDPREHPHADHAIDRRRTGLEGMGRDRARAPRRRADHRRAQGRTCAKTAATSTCRPAALWLYPTAEHQRAELLKPAYRHWVDLATAAPVGEPITIAGWADVTDVATITEAEHLDAIASKLIWTDEYASSRLKWKKRDPLWVLVLRVHRLDEPITVPWDEAYGGCTSWVTLERPARRPGDRRLAPGALRRRVRVEAQRCARVAARRVLGSGRVRRRARVGAARCAATPSR